MKIRRVLVNNLITDKAIATKQTKEKKKNKKKKKNKNK